MKSSGGDVSERASRDMLQQPRGKTVGIAGGLALILSPRECTIVSLSVPPLSHEDIDALVAARLRSHYPGNGAAAADWRTNGKRQVLAVASLRQRVATYLSEQDNAHIFVTADLARTAASDREYIALTLIDGRAEAWAIAQGNVLLAAPVSALPLSVATETPDGAATATAIQTAMARSRESLPDARVYLVSDRSDAALHAALAEFADRQIELEIAAARAARRYRPLFAKRPDRKKHLSVATVVLSVAALLILAIGAVARFGALREAEAQANAALVEAQIAYNRSIELEDQIAVLEAQAAGRAQGGPHAYAFLSSLVLSLPSADRVEQLSINRSAFELQAVGQSGLTSLERLRAAPGVAEVSLRQLVTENAGRERFVITGSFE